MKKIYAAAWIFAGCSLALLSFREFETHSTNTTNPSHLETLPITPASTSDGAAEYRSNLAIANARVNDQNPLRLFKPSGGLVGRMALEELFARGLPITAQSATLARTLLNSGDLTPDEKIPMIRILGSLYNRDNTTGFNNDIAFDLKALASSEDKQVAGAAAVEYANLEYRPDTDQVLRAALRSGALDENSYYQELAHLISSSPPEKRIEYLSEIRESRNSLARDVLVMALNSEQDFNAASFLRSSEDMAKLLLSNEPQFDYGVGLYGGVDGIRYREWLKASASIENLKSGRSVEDIVIAKLSEPGTDPRKIMGYLSGPDAASMLASAAPDSAVQPLVTAAERHAKQNPGNQHMTDIVQVIRERMKNPPPAIPAIVFMPPTSPVAPPVSMPHGPQAMPLGR